MFADFSGLNSISWGGTTTIGSSTFSGCGISSLTIPNSVTSMGTYSFSNCPNLTSVTLGTGLSEVSEGAFYNCALLNSISWGSISSIGDYAFSYCTGLTSISFPSSLTSIGPSAFVGCTGLTSLDLNISEYGDNSFNSCTGLESVTIGANVTYLGNSAFYGCSNLTNVMVLRTESKPTTGYNIFDYTSNDLVIYVPGGLLSEYKADYYMSNYPIKGWLQTAISGYGNSQESDHWRFIASPLVVDGGINPTTVDNLTTSEFDLYRLNEGTTNGGSEWENYENPIHTNGFKLINGQGYLYANQDDTDLMFKGDFSTDTKMEVELSYTPGSNIAGINLVGNPFPVNAYSNRPYYVMNADGNAVIATAISTLEPIAPCTGVIVKAEENEINPTVTFSTTAPVTSNKGNISITLNQQVNRGSATIDNAIVSFNESDQLGKYVFKADNAKVYIPQNGKDYAIVTAGSDNEMPINFKATRNGEYTLLVTPDNVEMEYLHLIDNLTGNDVDLLQTPSYTFNAKSDDYASRFRLVFKDNGFDESETNDDFAYFNGSEWVINYNGNASIQVIDALGHIIVSRRDGVHTISTIGIAPGVYVLRLIDGENVRNQKIIIK